VVDSSGNVFFSHGDNSIDELPEGASVAITAGKLNSAL